MRQPFQHGPRRDGPVGCSDQAAGPFARRPFHLRCPRPAGGPGNFPACAVQGRSHRAGATPGLGRAETLPCPHLPCRHEGFRGDRQAGRPLALAPHPQSRLQGQEVRRDLRSAAGRARAPPRLFPNDAGVAVFRRERHDPPQARSHAIPRFAEPVGSRYRCGEHDLLEARKAGRDEYRRARHLDSARAADQAQQLESARCRQRWCCQGRDRCGQAAGRGCHRDWPGPAQGPSLGRASTVCVTRHSRNWATSTSTC